MAGPDVPRRLRLGLIAAALVLSTGTAWRTWRLSEARPPADVTVRSVPIDSLAGGALLTPVAGTWTLRTGRDGSIQSFEPGEVVRLGKNRLRVRGGDGLRRTEVLRRDWSVFAPSTKGHRRIDFGADPLGKVDGVRDRVVLPAGAAGETGWFHLVPLSGGRFAEADAGRVALVVESDGLTLSVDGEDRELVAGDRVEVGPVFEVGRAGVRVEVRWETVVRARAVAGPGGRIRGYVDDRGTDFVVSAVTSGTGPSTSARLDLLDDDGASVASLRVSAERPTLLHGRRDRLSPLRGRVLPMSAPNEELEDAVRGGLRDGWIEVEPERTVVKVPTGKDSDEPREDLGWALSAAVVDLMDRYDRARAPVALRLDDGIRTPAATARIGDGDHPLRFDAELDAWRPSDGGPPGDAIVFRLPVEAGHTSVEVGAGFPISWRMASATTWRSELPPASDRWGSWTLAVTPGEDLLVRLDTVVAAYEDLGPGRVTVAVAGGPAGTLLQPGGVRLGTRAYEGWRSTRSASATTATKLWRKIPGDKWRAEGIGPEPRLTASRAYLRIPIAARSAGWTALDFEIPARVVSASWNGEAFEDSALPSAPTGGTGRLSVKTGAGTNVLALELELPPTAPREQAGSVRFVTDDAGQLQALDARVTDRRSRKPVRDDSEAAPIPDRDGRDAPWVEVERGSDEVEAGRRLRLAVAPDRAGAVTVELAEGVEVETVTDSDGTVAVTTNRPATLWSRDGRPMTVVPHVPAQWAEGARLVVEQTPVRLRRPTTSEVAAFSARPSWMRRWPDGERTTLDDDLQADADAALEAELDELDPADGDTLALRGVVLLMDARTGDVLACAAQWRDGMDPRAVAPEPCWQDAGVHPGSTFKIATGGAGLVSGDPVVRRMLDGDLPAQFVADGPRGSMKGLKLPLGPSDTKPRVLRSVLRNFGGKPMPTDADLEDALRSSWNVWFGYLGVLLHRPLREGWVGAGVADEAERLAAWPVAAIARKAGFDERLDLGAGYVGTGGHVPVDAPESDARIAARAIGQDGVTATPVGVAGLVAMTVEGGLAPRPRISLDRPEERVRVLPADAAERLRLALADVVARGTASAAFTEHPRRDRVVGKTGSSQRIDGAGLQRTDAWFAGAVLPPEGSDEAPIVVVVELPGAGLGGRHAASLAEVMARRVAEARGWQ